MARSERLIAALTLLVVLAAGVAIGVALGRTWLAPAHDETRRPLPPHPPGPFGPPPLDHLLQHFRDELSLTDDQATRIQVLMEETHERAQAIRRESFPKMHTMRTEMQQRIRELLTPDQVTRYNRMIEERDRRRHKKRKRRGRWRE